MEVITLLKSTMTHVIYINNINDKTISKLSNNKYNSSHIKNRGIDNQLKPNLNYYNTNSLKKKGDSAIIVQNLNSLTAIFSQGKNEICFDNLEIIAYYLTTVLFIPQPSTNWKQTLVLYPDWPYIRAAAYRTIRYFMTFKILDTFINTFHLDYFIASDLDVISRLEIEKVQAFKVCYKIMHLDPLHFPQSLIKPIQSIIQAGFKSKETENIFQTALSFICEYVILNHKELKLNIQTYIIQSLISSAHTLNVNVHQLVDVVLETFCYTLSNMNENESLTQLPIDIDPLISYFTAGHLKGVDIKPIAKRKSCIGIPISTLMSSKSKIDSTILKTVCQYTLIQLFRNWPGFRYLLVDSNNTFGLKALLNALKMPFPSSQEAIMEILASILYLPFPSEPLENYKDLHCWKGKLKLQSNERWKLSNGYVASEICDGLILSVCTPIYPQMPNLTLCYQGLILHALIESNIAQTLMDVIMGGGAQGNGTSIKACYLLGEIIKMGYVLLPQSPPPKNLSNLEELIRASLSPSVDGSDSLLVNNDSLFASRISASSALNYLYGLHSDCSEVSPFLHQNVSDFGIAVARILGSVHEGTIRYPSVSTTSNSNSFNRSVAASAGGLSGSRRFYKRFLRRKLSYIITRSPQPFTPSKNEMETTYDDLKYHVNASGVVALRDESSSWNWKIVEYIVATLKNNVPYRLDTLNLLFSDMVKGKKRSVEKSPLWKLLQNVWNFFLPSRCHYGTESISTSESRRQTAIFIGLFDILWDLAAFTATLTTTTVAATDDVALRNSPNQLTRLLRPYEALSRKTSFKRLFKPINILAESSGRNKSKSVPLVTLTKPKILRLSLGLPARTPESLESSSDVIPLRINGVGEGNKLDVEPILTDSMSPRLTGKMALIRSLSRSMIVDMITDFKSCLLDACQERIPSTSILNLYALSGSNSQNYFLIVGILLSRLNAAHNLDLTPIRDLKIDALIERMDEVLSYSHTPLSKLIITSLFSCFQPYGGDFYERMRELYLKALQSKYRDVRTYAIHYTRACVRCIYAKNVHRSTKDNRRPWDSSKSSKNSINAVDWDWLVHPLLEIMLKRKKLASLTRKLAYLTLEEILSVHKVDDTFIRKLISEASLKDFDVMQIVCKICGSPETFYHLYARHNKFLHEILCVWKEAISCYCVLSKKHSATYPDLIENRSMLLGLGYEPNARNRITPSTAASSYFPWVKSNPGLVTSPRTGSLHERAQNLIASIVNSSTLCGRSVGGNCDLENCYPPLHLIAQLAGHGAGLRFLCENGLLKEIKQRYLTLKALRHSLDHNQRQELKSLLWSLAHLHRSLTGQEGIEKDLYISGLCSFISREITNAFKDFPSLDVKATAFYCLNTINRCDPVSDSAVKDIQTRGDEKLGMNGHELNEFKKLANPYMFYHPPQVGTGESVERLVDTKLRDVHNVEVNSYGDAPAPDENSHKYQHYESLGKISSSNEKTFSRTPKHKIYKRALTFFQLTPPHTLKKISRSATMLKTIATWPKTLVSEPLFSNPILKPTNFEINNEQLTSSFFNRRSYEVCIPGDVLDVLKESVRINCFSSSTTQESSSHSESTSATISHPSTPLVSSLTRGLVWDRDVSLLNYTLLNESVRGENPEKPANFPDSGYRDVPRVLIPNFDDYYTTPDPRVMSQNLRFIPLETMHRDDKKHEFQSCKNFEFSLGERPKVFNKSREFVFPHASHKCIKCCRLKFLRAKSSSQRTISDEESELIRGGEYEVVRNRLLYLLSDSLLCFYTYKAAEQEVLYQKCQHPDLFKDACFYSDVAFLLATNSYHLRCRQMVQELFGDVDFTFMLLPLE